MPRASIGWLVLGLTVMAGGCKMCDSPYDYCGPTFAGGCNGSCQTEARAGSILSGVPGSLPEGEAVAGAIVSTTEKNVAEPVKADAKSPNDLPPEPPKPWKGTSTTTPPKQFPAQAKIR